MTIQKRRLRTQAEESRLADFANEMGRFDKEQLLDGGCEVMMIEMGNLGRLALKNYYLRREL